MKLLKHVSILIILGKFQLCKFEQYKNITHKAPFYKTSNFVHYFTYVCTTEIIIIIVIL